MNPAAKREANKKQKQKNKTGPESAQQQVRKVIKRTLHCAILTAAVQRAQVPGQTNGSHESPRTPFPLHMLSESAREFIETNAELFSA